MIRLQVRAFTVLHFLLLSHRALPLLTEKQLAIDIMLCVPRGQQPHALRLLHLRMALFSRCLI